MWVTISEPHRNWKRKYETQEFLKAKCLYCFLLDFDTRHCICYNRGKRREEWIGEMHYRKL